MAGALTGGFLQIRSGLKPAFRSAVFGGVLLAVIEGLGITLSKMMAAPPPGAPMQQPPPGMPPPAPGAPAPLPPPLGADLAINAAGSSGGGGELGVGGSGQPTGADGASSSGSGGGGFWSWITGGEDKVSVVTGAQHSIRGATVSA